MGLVDAVRRVALDELGLEVAARELLGYIEYPSHHENGLDSPVGLAFRSEPIADSEALESLPEACAWFTRLPDGLYEEQREFLVKRLGLRS